MGDSVFLKLQPYIQSSVAPRAHHKLLFKYYGPYTVLERVGASAYQLALPAASKIHPVLHVSQLKLALGPHCQVQSELPPPDAQFAVPVRVLQRHLHRRGDEAVPQGLVQCLDQPDSLVTWEDLEELKQRFQRAPAWGQDGHQERGSVSTGHTSTMEATSATIITKEGRPSKKAHQPSPRYANGDWVPT